MEAFFKMFALTFLAEKVAWTNLKSYEEHATKLTGVSPTMASDRVYSSLVDHWDSAYNAHEKAKDELVKAWSELTVDQAILVK